MGQVAAGRVAVRQVVVTGGGTGIGYAVAEAFTAAGERVTITGRRRTILDRAADRLGVRSVDFDAADPAAVAAALAELPTRVDVLINCAGGLAPAVRPAPPAGLESPAAAELVAVEAEWQAMLAMNLMSAVLVTAALTPRLPHGGRVVSVGSIAANRGAGGYGAAKAALVAWNASLATALGPRGVTANVVSPGLVLDTEFFGDGLSAQRKERLVAETKTGQASTPGDVAVVVRMLAAPEARQVTGQVVHVNGGAYLGH